MPPRPPCGTPSPARPHAPAHAPRSGREPPRPHILAAGYIVAGSSPLTCASLPAADTAASGAGDVIPRREASPTRPGDVRGRQSAGSSSGEGWRRRSTWEL
jgi:hypothetical protein